MTSVYAVAKYAHLPMHGTLLIAIANAMTLKPHLIQRLTPQKLLVKLRTEQNGTLLVVNAKFASHKFAQISTYQEQTTHNSGIQTAALANAFLILIASMASISIIVLVSFLYEHPEYKYFVK